MENKIIETIKTMQELKRMKEELDAAIEKEQEKIKSYMGENEVAIIGEYKVIYKKVVQNRIDTTALKKELPDVAARYSKQVETRPLKVS